MLDGSAPFGDGDGQLAEEGLGGGAGFLGQHMLGHGAAPSRTISGRCREMGAATRRGPDLEPMEGLGGGGVVGPAPSRAISG